MSQIVPCSPFVDTTQRQRERLPLVILLSLLLGVAGIWYGISDLSIHARLAFSVLLLAVVGWIFTDINDAYIALTAALVFTLTGFTAPEEFFATFGDSTIWLMLASFIVAEAVATVGLSRRLTSFVALRSHSVTQLFYLLTAVLLVTAFVIPATSGRAALMLPVFLALRLALEDAKISRALALLFPTIILLSAIASLLGAGAHLVTVEIVRRLTGENIDFTHWLAWGLPFALVSCFGSTWVILHLFLNRQQRRHALQLSTLPTTSFADAPNDALMSSSLSRAEWYVLGVVVTLVGLWSSEAWHGLNATVVALLGALAVTAPRWGVISFKTGVSRVDWQLLLFLAATLELSDAFIASGGAQWLMHGAFQALQGSFVSSALFLIAAISSLSLLSHLLITSRTARSSVLIPLVVVLGMSLGYNPTALAFLSTAAAGFCLTLPVSAKPVVIFSQLDGPTYRPRDLLRLSSVLLPLHLGLLLAFAFVIWPALGLPLKQTTLPTPASVTRGYSFASPAPHSALPTYSLFTHDK
jgi:anion transporter